MLKSQETKKTKKVQSESDFMPARASPSGFAVPYNFSIPLTCGFCFSDVHARRHLALKGLNH